MCGRYAIVPDSRAWADVTEILGAGLREILLDLKARYNIPPTTSVPIIIEDRKTRKPSVIEAKWGLIPTWWKELKPPPNTINAKVERASSSGMWRGPFRSQRCLIPATHYYEWQKSVSGKIPFAITVDEGLGFMFAGLWSVWVDPTTGEEVATCAILTRDAPEAIADIHERMPIILAPAMWREWLSRDLTDPASIKKKLDENTILEVETFKIGSRVGSPRNNDPDILKRI